MKRVNRTVLAMFIIVIGLVGIDEVRADPLAPPSIDDSEWRIDISPYVFLPVSVTGDSTVSGQTASLDLDTSDLLDVLSFAFSARMEAWKGDFGLILDGMYISLDADGTIVTPGPLALNIGVDVDVEQFYLDVLGGYRVIHRPYDADGNMWSLDLTGGIRYNYLKQEVDVSVSGGPGPGAATTLGGSETWVDPMLGARVAVALNERWAVGARGDIGGFGISDTDLTWSVTGGFDYRPWERTSLKFGWRAYSIDYSTTLSDGAFAYDIFEHGPYVAVTFRFQ